MGSQKDTAVSMRRAAGRWACSAAGFFAALGFLAPALADVSIHGFGQIIAGTTLSNDRLMYDLPYQADASFQPESLFAVQVQAPLAEHLMATMQLEASGGDETPFQPKMEWAYASYWAGEHWLLKAGRLRIPLYRYSDTLEVGFSYPWIRPPQSVYQSLISSYDGALATGYYELGNWSLQPMIGFGTVTEQFLTGGAQFNVNLHSASGAVLAASYSSWLDLRVSYFLTQGSIDSNALDPLRSVILPNSVYSDGSPADNSAVIQALGPADHTLVFYGAGIDLHPGHWQLKSEFTSFRFNDTMFWRQNDWYVMAGYRFGRFTPNLTYGHVDSASSDPGIVGSVAGGSQCPVGVAASGMPIFQSCNSVVQSAIDTQRELSDYYEAGLRYEIGEHTALKLDWTRYLAHEPAGTGPGVSPVVNLFSAGIAFIF